MDLIKNNLDLIKMALIGLENKAPYARIAMLRATLIDIEKKKSNFSIGAHQSDNASFIWPDIEELTTMLKKEYADIASSIDC